jgi:hypothetical protein
LSTYWKVYLAGSSSCYFHRHSWEKIKILESQNLASYQLLFLHLAVMINLVISILTTLGRQHWSLKPTTQDINANVYCNTVFVLLTARFLWMVSLFSWTFQY